MIQIKPPRDYWLVHLSKCLSGRICNQILQILAPPVQVVARIHCSIWSHRHLVQTIITICPLHTSLRSMCKPTYPDFKHHVHWGCIEASRSEFTFPNPDFCGTGAFGAGLITLDGPMPTFLYHVCLQAPKFSSNNGTVCSRAIKWEGASK